MQSQGKNEAPSRSQARSGIRPAPSQTDAPPYVAEANSQRSSGDGSSSQALDPRADTPPSSTKVYHLEPNIESTATLPEGRWLRWAEGLARDWGRNRLTRLIARKGRVSKTMKNIPARMHRAARQSELLLELIDDFRSGTYREIPWRSVAIASGILLYTVNPADVIPDILPVVGSLDEAALIAIGTRLMRKDLAEYCEFKGYDFNHYFGAEAA